MSKEKQLTEKREKTGEETSNDKLSLGEFAELLNNGTIEIDGGKIYATPLKLVGRKRATTIPIDKVKDTKLPKESVAYQPVTIPENYSSYGSLVSLWRTKIVTSDKGEKYLSLIDVVGGEIIPDQKAKRVLGEETYHLLKEELDGDSFVLLPLISDSGRTRKEILTGFFDDLTVGKTVLPAGHVSEQLGFMVARCEPETAWTQRPITSFYANPSNKRIRYGLARLFNEGELRKAFDSEGNIILAPGEKRETTVKKNTGQIVTENSYVVQKDFCESPRPSNSPVASVVKDALKHLTSTVMERNEDADTILDYLPKDKDGEPKINTVKEVFDFSLMNLDLQPSDNYVVNPVTPYASVVIDRDKKIMKYVKINKRTGHVERVSIPLHLVMPKQELEDLLEYWKYYEPYKNVADIGEEKIKLAVEKGRKIKIGKQVISRFLSKYRLAEKSINKTTVSNSGKKKRGKVSKQYLRLARLVNDFLVIYSVAKQTGIYPEIEEEKTIKNIYNSIVRDPNYPRDKAPEERVRFIAEKLEEMLSKNKGNSEEKQIMEMVEDFSETIREITRAISDYEALVKNNVNIEDTIDMEELVKTREFLTALGEIMELVEKEKEKQSNKGKTGDGKEDRELSVFLEIEELDPMFLQTYYGIESLVESEDGEVMATNVGKYTGKLSVIVSLEPDKKVVNIQSKKDEETNNAQNKRGKKSKGGKRGKYVTLLDEKAVGEAIKQCKVVDANLELWRTKMENDYCGIDYGQTENMNLFGIDLKLQKITMKNVGTIKPMGNSCVLVTPPPITAKIENDATKGEKNDRPPATVFPVSQLPNSGIVLCGVRGVEVKQNNEAEEKIKEYAKQKGYAKPVIQHVLDDNKLMVDTNATFGSMYEQRLYDMVVVRDAENPNKEELLTVSGTCSVIDVSTESLEKAIGENNGYVTLPLYEEDEKQFVKETLLKEEPVVLLKEGKDYALNIKRINAIINGTSLLANASDGPAVIISCTPETTIKKPREITLKDKMIDKTNGNKIVDITDLYETFKGEGLLRSMRPTPNHSTMIATFGNPVGASAKNKKESKQTNPTKKIVSKIKKFIIKDYVPKNLEIVVPVTIPKNKQEGNQEKKAEKSTNK